MDTKPPPFVVFRTPAKPERVDAYQLALDFTASVGALMDKLDARFHLKDRLDRNAAAIAMAVGQAAADLAPAGRRKTYRHAHALTVDCSTILDILARRAGVDRSHVEPAQRLVAQLLSQLEQLRNQSV